MKYAFINNDMLSQTRTQHVGESAFWIKAPSLKMKRPPMRWREPGAGATGGNSRLSPFLDCRTPQHPQLASPSPELLIARILGQTTRIRVGSGGVMLQHYSPYKVAENFNLRLPRLPDAWIWASEKRGGLPLSTRALQLGLNQQEKGSFAEQLAQLDSWIRPENQSAEEAVRATPLPPVPAQGFLLGASVESALLAAKLNWHFVFAAHLNGDPDLLREVITTGVNTAPGR